MELRQIELEVLAIHGSINLRPTIDKARRLGELLIEAKARLPHGHYLSWLARVGMNRKTAHVYVLVAQAKCLVNEPFGHLGACRHPPPWQESTAEGPCGGTGERRHRPETAAGRHLRGQPQPPTRAPSRFTTAGKSSGGTPCRGRW